MSNTHREVSWSARLPMKLCRQRSGKKEIQKTDEQKKYWVDTHKKVHKCKRKVDMGKSKKVLKEESGKIGTEKIDYI